MKLITYSSCVHYNLTSPTVMLIRSLIRLVIFDLVINNETCCIEIHNFNTTCLPIQLSNLITRYNYVAKT